MGLPNDVPLPSFPIEFVAVPPSNYRKGRNCANPDVVVLHIAEGSKASVLATFQDPAVQKSSHFLVCRDGSVTQFVNTGSTAFCNGIVVNPISEVVLCRLPANPNDYTVSIEHEGFGTQDITPEQYTTTVALVKYLHAKWNIPLDRSHIIAHREIEAIKTCPGVLNVEKVIQMARL